MKISEQMLELAPHRFFVQHITHSQPKHPATVVFLHDSLGCVELWRDFPATIAQKTGLNVVVYDRVGHGKSSGFVAPRQLDYLYTESFEVFPAVLDALGLDKVILLGHSDGGTIALLAASHIPEKVVAVITEGAHVFVEDETLQGIKEAVDTYSRVAPKLQKYHGDKVAQLYAAWTQTWLTPEFKAWNMQSHLPKIQCPTLVIQGLDDEFGTPEQVQCIVAGVQQGQALLLSNCKHTPHRQAPNEVETAVLSFVRQAISMGA